MINKTINVSIYQCEKCSKEFKTIDECIEHEDKCTFDYIGSIVKHIGTFTKESKCLDEFNFWRMCSLEHYKHHVWLNVNKQFIIGKADRQFKTNWYWSPTTKQYAQQQEIFRKSFFEFDPSNKHDNVVHFKTESLQKCHVTVTYTDKSVVKFDHTSDVCVERTIQLFEDNKIVSIVLTDVDRSNPEEISYEEVNNKCKIKCQYQENHYVVSHSCTQGCPNYVKETGNVVLCNFKNNHK